MSGLIITRRPGEAIYIGSNVKVTILGHTGNQIRLSIQAPKNVSIDREDVRERKLQESDFNPGEVK